MNRVETKGSVWMLDDDQLRYARMPKHEGPRLSPPGADWGGSGACALQDLVWHPMVRWEIQQKPVMAVSVNPWTFDVERIDTGDVQPILVIHLPGDNDEVIVAPDAEVAA